MLLSLNLMRMRKVHMCFEPMCMSSYCILVALTLRLLCQDINGSLPKCHIPARFCVLIPKEFPASKELSASTPSKNRAGNVKQASPVDPKPASKRASKTANAPVDGDLALNDMIGETAYEGFSSGGGGMDFAFDFSNSGESQPPF